MVKEHPFERMVRKLKEQIGKLDKTSEEYKKTKHLLHQFEEVLQILEIPIIQEVPDDTSEISV